MRAKTAAATAGILGMALGSGEVAALETVHGGLECTASPPIIAGIWSYNSIGGVQNDQASDDLWVVCPIAQFSSAGGGISDVQMYVADQNSNDNIACELRCVEDDSNTLSTVSSQSSGSTGLNQLLDFAAVSGYQDGYCFVYCKIPDLNDSDSKESWIANYVTTE
jgi:hypothetical protein